MRRTKVVATIGPASETPETLAQLFEAGADIFRFNFSHGTHEEHARRFSSVQKLEREVDRPILVFADLQGPKIRLGVFADGPVNLETGQTFRLDMDEAHGDGSRAPLPHPEVFGALVPGSRLLIDDGKVRLKVVRCEPTFCEAEVTEGGAVSDRKGVNVPDVDLASSPLTDKDRTDLEFAMAIGIPMVAMSFVQNPDDIREAREAIAGRARLIAKLEKPSAIQHLTDIVALSDAVMVARGDLGVELPPEDVPGLQKRIIRVSRSAGKPVIVATQMLDSMIGAPAPTRAEASDVANAVFEGADAVMLSGETAAGRFPVESVRMMDRIVVRTESDRAYDGLMRAQITIPETTNAAAIAAAACEVAVTIDAKAIIAFTMSGSTAMRLARQRPTVPVIAVTPDRQIVRCIMLGWGVLAYEVDQKVDEFGDLVELAYRYALASKVAEPGDKLVMVAGLPMSQPGKTNVLHIIQI
jgi:pyruvate kinase